MRLPVLDIMLKSRRISHKPHRFEHTVHEIIPGWFTDNGQVNRRAARWFGLGSRHPPHLGETGDGKEANDEYEEFDQSPLGMVYLPLRRRVYIIWRHPVS